MKAARRQLVEEALQARGLDGLIAWRPEEIVMLTGLQSHWGLTVALVARNTAPLLLVPHLEPLAETQGLEIVTFPWGKPGAWDLVAETVARWSAGRRLAWKGAGGHASLPANFAENPPWPPTWASDLPGARCDEVLDELLAIKTTDDIEALRRTHRVAADALETFRTTTQPGATEAEVAAVVEASVHRQTGREGITTSRAWACVQSGPNTADSGRFNRSSGRALREGERVLLEIAVCVDGYWADLTESLLCGGGHESTPLLPVIADAARAALAEVRPGAKAGAIDRAARNVITSAGYGAAFTHATGHPTGFRYHDPGPMLAPGVADSLREGMVLTIEPGIYFAGEGARLECNIAVTPSSAEVLGGRLQ